MGVIVEEEGDCTLESQRSYIHLKEEDKDIFSPNHEFDQQFRLNELSEISCVCVRTCAHTCWCLLCVRALFAS